MGENGAQHVLGSGKKPGTEKEAGLVLSFLVRFPRGLRCRHPQLGAVRIPSSCHGASLLPAHIDRGSDGCKEVWVGRSRGSGIEVPEAPTPGGGEGADSFVLFALLLDMPCHLSVPLLLSYHREL